MANETSYIHKKLTNQFPSAKIGTEIFIKEGFSCISIYFI